MHRIATRLPVVCALAGLADAQTPSSDSDPQRMPARKPRFADERIGKNAKLPRRWASPVNRADGVTRASDVKRFPQVPTRDRAAAKKDGDENAVSIAWTDLVDFAARGVRHEASVRSIDDTTRATPAVHRQLRASMECPFDMPAPFAVQRAVLRFSGNDVVANEKIQ